MRDISSRVVEAINADLGSMNPFLTSDMSPHDAKSLWLRESIMKKYVGRGGVKPSDRANAALTLWDQMNLRCKTSFRIPTGDDYIDDSLFHMKELFYKHVNAWDGPRLTLQAAVSHGRPGPGKAAGLCGVDFSAKFAEDIMSMSDPKLYAYYLAYIDSRWRSMECERIAKSGEPVIVTSEVFTVPKSREIDRVALKEPTLNMFFQLGIGHLIEGVLREKHGIILSTQPTLNRTMARLGSISGKYATIDLKSASDTISLKFAQWLMDSKTFECFKHSRSWFCDRGPLYMLSSMGNGFTFPLQTLIFATLVRTVYIELGIPFRDTEFNIPSYSVFGDDIVVDRRAYHRVCRLLERCGFIVNFEKSFNEGPFRESCGKDYFKGHDIRGVYIKELSTHEHAFSAFNRLARWSVRHSIAIPRTLQSIFGSVPFRPVPFDAGDTAGHHWPRGLLHNLKTDRGLDFYRAHRPVARKRKINPGPYGQLITALGGYASAGKASMYCGIPSYTTGFRVVRESTPSWDWIPYPGLNIRDYTHLCRLVTCREL